MVIKNKCFIVLWTILTLSAFCQENNYITYYNIRNQALAHKVEENYQEAIVLYNRAFSSAFPFSDDIKHLISCYLNMKDTTNALQAMRLLIKSGYKLDQSLPLLEDDGTRVYSNFHFTLSKDELLNALLSKEYDSLRNEFLANNNIDNLHYQKTGKSLYGMQRISFDDAAPIQDIENIDARREKLFLPPLWVYYKDKGYTLPKSYKSQKE
ncbi:MAG: hypothetical protein LBG80_09370 [Bacteroidales bacterium]|jgi:hypothetical protein|nr:hypothetical protein [Bacteroidales bacterium]